MLTIGVKEILKPYRRRMLVEAWILSAATGLTAALPVSILLVLAGRIGQLGDLLFPLAAVLPVLAVLLFYMLRFRPSPERMARRLDSMGLQNAVGTMVEFQQDDSLLCRLQREDTAEKLKQIQPKALRLQLPVRRLAACAVLLVLAAGAVWVPASLLGAAGPQVPEEDGQLTGFRTGLEELRGRIVESSLSADKKAALLAELQALQDEADAGRIDLAALTELSQRLQKETETNKGPLNSYAQALMLCENLGPVGAALQTENMQKISAALGEVMEHLLSLQGNDRCNAIMEIIREISATLKYPVKDERDNMLAHAFTVFSGDLDGAASVTYEGRSSDQQIRRAVSGLQTRIAKYYKDDPEEEKEAQAGEEQAAQASNARYSRWSAQPTEAPVVSIPSETEYVYDPSEAALTSGYVPGLTAADGTVQRITAPKDPSLDGTVPYGTVFGSYYAKYLEQVRENKVPEELHSEAEKYFNGL